MDIGLSVNFLLGICNSDLRITIGRVQWKGSLGFKINTYTCMHDEHNILISFPYDLRSIEPFVAAEPRTCEADFASFLTASTRFRDPIGVGVGSIKEPCQPMNFHLNSVALRD